MKNYIKEIIIFIVQLLMFYIFPLTAGPTDMMGLVIVLLLSTFILSIVIGSFSNKSVKYLYPLAVSVGFLPSVFIYYNETAFVHSLWYLVVSTVGLLIGMVIYKLVEVVNKQ